MITPVSETELQHLRGAIGGVEGAGQIAYLGAWDALVAEVRALRVVADAAERMARRVGVDEELRLALRDAGRLP